MAKQRYEPRPLIDPGKWAIDDNMTQAILLGIDGKIITFSDQHYVGMACHYLNTSDGASEYQRNRAANEKAMEES